MAARGFPGKAPGGHGPLLPGKASRGHGPLLPPGAVRVPLPLRHWPGSAASP